MTGDMLVILLNNVGNFAAETWQGKENMSNPFIWLKQLEENLKESEICATAVISTVINQNAVIPACLFPFSFVQKGGGPGKQNS